MTTKMKVKKGDLVHMINGMTVASRAASSTRVRRSGG